MKQRMNSKTKSSINKLLYHINREYHRSIPIIDIDNILMDYGYWLVQEDGSRWSGFLLGSEGTVHIDIANEKGVVANTMLYLQWYKMSSGKYEITCYVS